jgi:hypothetical protein
MLQAAASREGRLLLNRLTSGEEQMSLRKRVMAVTVLAAAAFGVLGTPAMAVAMPWETSKVLAVRSATVGHSTTVTIQCANGCYQ